MKALFVLCATPSCRASTCQSSREPHALESHTALILYSVRVQSTAHTLPALWNYYMRKSCPLWFRPAKFAPHGARALSTRFPTTNTAVCAPTLAVLWPAISRGKVTASIILLQTRPKPLPASAIKPTARQDYGTLFHWTIRACNEWGQSKAAPVYVQEAALSHVLLAPQELPPRLAFRRPICSYPCDLQSWEMIFVIRCDLPSDRSRPSGRFIGSFLVLAVTSILSMGQGKFLGRVSSDARLRHRYGQGLCVSFHEYVADGGQSFDIGSSFQPESSLPLYP